jgi:hypothetical protein
MATIGGPNTEKDNLVFGYDTGYGVADNSTSTRFYPGEPAVNISSTHFSSGHNSSGYGNVVTVVDAPEKGTGWKKVTISNRGSNFRILQWQYTTHTSDVVYTHSAVFDWGNMRDKGYFLGFDGNGGGTRNYFRNGDESTNGGGTINSSLKDGKFSSNITKSGTHSHAWFINHSTTGVSGLNDYFYYNEYQVEINTHSTPYTSGTRSDTASLIDLKRTTSIDVSNISFNSTGQPTLDGSNDQLVVDVDDIVRNASNVTIEGMVNATSISSAGPWAILTDHATASDKDGFWWHYNIGNAVYFRVEDATAGEQGTTFSGAVPFVANTYQHIVTVVGDSNVKVYVNGVLSKSYTPNFKWNRIDSSKTAYLHIGRTYPSYYLSCAIPVFKMYNRELSVDEIKQNFNAYKNRFGI